MKVMVVETFLDGNTARVGERFRRNGRMLPDGVLFLESWMSTDGSKCYQLMETPSVEALEPWMTAWSDLVGFEVVGVVDSAEYWRGD